MNHDKAGVPAFLDLQLAGPYGRAERWYMQRPRPRGIDGHGYQLRYTPAQLYRQAIAGIDTAGCRARRWRRQSTPIRSAWSNHAGAGDVEDLRQTLRKSSGGWRLAASPRRGGLG